jgi:hypothetical protein
MKAETHLKMWLRDKIENWSYIDSILFLFILLLSSGFTNPCDRCMVTTEFSPEPISCEQAFEFSLKEPILNEIKIENITLPPNFSPKL